MPDKEGSDDEKKSTKSVVNKKTKQMMNQEEYLPEEEYDHYKDRMAMAGREIRSKDTKDASSYPQSRKKVKGDTPMQKEFKKKYGKKATALDAVKADITKKYGKGAIMDVGKKKANEELDLTKIAEAFGGYIIESTPQLGPKSKEYLEKLKKEKARSGRISKREVKIGAQGKILPGEGEASKESELLKRLQKNLTATGEIPDPRRAVADDPEFYGRFDPTYPIENPKADDGTIGVAPGEKPKPVIKYQKGTRTEGPVARAQRLKREKAEKAEKSAAASERNRNRKLVGSGSREVSPEIQKKLDAIKKEIENRPLDKRTKAYKDFMKQDEIIRPTRDEFDRIKLSKEKRIDQSKTDFDGRDVNPEVQKRVDAIKKEIDNKPADKRKKFYKDFMKQYEVIRPTRDEFDRILLSKQKRIDQSKTDFDGRDVKVEPKVEPKTSDKLLKTRVVDYKGPLPGIKDAQERRAKSKAVLTRAFKFIKRNPLTSIIGLDTVSRSLGDINPLELKGGRAGLRSAAR